MLKQIDQNISTLLKHRDSTQILNDDKLRAMICTVIEKAYFLESIILLKRTFTEKQDDQFFLAKTSVNRYFRDAGLDEVADIYNELQSLAEPYLRK
jgi:hypothetical protein